MATNYLRDGQNLVLSENVSISSELAVAGDVKFGVVTSVAPQFVGPVPAVPGSGAQTITIANLLTGILHDDPEGAATWTLPTAALAVAGVSSISGSAVEVGQYFDFYVINDATTTVDEPITIAMGTSGTAVGHMLVEANAVAGEESSGSGHFRLRFTNVTASSEAYTCYRLA